MKLRFISILLIFIFITGCSKSDDLYPKLDGYYSLVDISCQCSPARFIPNQQQISIDFDENKLIIRNFGEEIPDKFHREGEYGLQIENNIVNLNGINFEFRMALNCLIFDSASPSGNYTFPIFIFRKN